MNSVIIKNKFDSNDYRISIIPVRKSASIPDSWAEFYPAGSNPVREDTGENVLKPRRFDSIFEAAIFKKGGFWKPLFFIEYGSTIDPVVENLKNLTESMLKRKINLAEDKITEEEFTKSIHHIIANENIDDAKNGVSDLYSKYGFVATKHDMWQLFFLSKTRIIFIDKSSL